jgi:hypothetical protein
MKQKYSDDDFVVSKGDYEVFVEGLKEVIVLEKSEMVRGEYVKLLKRFKEDYDGERNVIALGRGVSDG